MGDEMVTLTLLVEVLVGASGLKLTANKLNELLMIMEWTQQLTMVWWYRFDISGYSGYDVLWVTIGL